MARIAFSESDQDPDDTHPLRLLRDCQGRAVESNAGEKGQDVSTSHVITPQVTVTSSVKVNRFAASRSRTRIAT